MRKVRYFKFDSEESRLSRIPSVWVPAISIPFLIYLVNPATSLIVGAAVSLLLGLQGPPRAHLIVQSALQIAVVLIGLNLDTQQLTVSRVPIRKHTDSTLFDENGNLALKLETRALSKRGSAMWLR